MNRMDTARRAAIVRCLVDGVGVRATCRITGASKGGVLKLIADLGPVRRRVPRRFAARSCPAACWRLTSFGPSLR